MRNMITNLIGFVLLGILTYLYFVTQIRVELDRIFLTIITFLFATVAGFFLARQGARYSSLRKTITDFDGVMSALYRVSGHFGEGVQSQVGNILKNYYKRITENKAWDYNITRKTTTLTDIHQLISEVIGDEKFTNRKNWALNNMFMSLYSAQLFRKNMFALRQERIPKLQWLLIIILSLILIFSISAIPSAESIYESFIKSTSVITILIVLLILRRFERLQMFEGIIGENSAQDVLDLIEGSR